MYLSKCYVLSLFFNTNKKWRVVIMPICTSLILNEELVIATKRNQKTTLTPQVNNTKSIAFVSISNDFLKIETIKKMLHRFLDEKKMSEKELCGLLGIDLKELGLIFSNQKLPALISKINLPLIKLYCKTKFFKFNSRRSYGNCDPIV